MFSLVFVCLSVCLLARLLKNACMDLDELLQKLYNDKNSTQLKNTTYKTTNAQYTLATKSTVADSSAMVDFVASGHKGSKRHGRLCPLSTKLTVLNSTL